MSYLLDTNVVSELARKAPDRAVLAWFRDISDQSLHLSVLTLGEIRRGVERLPDGARKEGLRVWLEVALPAWFGDRLLPVDSGVADRWGRLASTAARSVPAVDCLLAATAIHHGLRLVTRNVKDFAFPGLDLVNPWL